MRGIAALGLVSFTVSLFAIGGLTQPRRPPPRGRRPPVAVAPDAAPMSPRIAQELGQLRWGLSRAQVIDYYRTLIRANYQPRMKNLGALEQHRIIEQREGEIRRVERSVVEFDGAPARRLWDTSFISEEYTHNNNESMLVYEDARGNREFFFFINDRLWKRLQARNTAGAHIDMDDFSSQLEAIFGPGRRVMEGMRLRTVEWRDEATHLHVIDNTTFFSVFCLVYEEIATQLQLPTLRRNVPTKTARQQATADRAQPEVGNVTGDHNSDIVDRITGKIRRVPSADAGSSASTSVTQPGGPGTPARRDAGAAPASENDPLGGLGF